MTKKSVNEFKTQTLLFLRTVLKVSNVLSQKEKLFSIKPPPHTTVNCRRAGWVQGKILKDSKKDSKMIKNF